MSTRRNILLFITCLIHQSMSQAITTSETISSCSETEYYDTMLLLCQSCPENTVPASDRLSCQCDLGFFVDQASQFDFFPTCVECPASQGPTQDQLACLPCGDDSTYSDTLRDCVCPTFSVLVDTDANGNYLAAKECQPCLTENFYQGPANRPIYQCEACPFDGQFYSNVETPWTCSCQTGWATAGNKCLLTTDVTRIPSQFPLNNANSIFYYFLENKGTEEDGTFGQLSISIADTFTYLYQNAAVGCQVYKDPNQCQVLANLCVLQLYDEATIVCQLFQFITENSGTPRANTFYPDNGWKQDYPWLYYQRNAVDVIRQSNRLTMRVSFGFNDQKRGIMSSLFYKLAKYDLEGSFLGFEDLTDQLQLCQTSANDIERFRRFGTTIENECTFDLSVLTSNNAFDRPDNSNMFYELFIKDYDGNLIDVPVLIKNFRDQNGDLPNEEGSDEQDWRLVRRFFLFDTVSGLQGENAYENGSINPTAIRYPTEIKLRITLDPDVEEKIFTPLLIIDYRERSAVYILENPLANVAFISEYAMNTNVFFEDANTAFIIVNVFAGVLLLFRMVLFYNTPSLVMEGDAKCKQVVFTFFFNLFDYFSYFNFWFLFGLTAYWFVFFKLEERVFLLLPALNTYETNYKPFIILFGLVACTKLVAILYKIITQAEFDVFLIDWERPKRSKSEGDKVQPAHLVNYAWRRIFVMNELNELQMTKMISSEFTLIMYAFIMEGLGVRYFSTHNPQIDNQHFDSPENYALKFFLTTFVLVSLGIIQHGGAYIIKKCKSLKHEDFVDICCISNISVLFFDSGFHGYYIHGKSPYGQADVSAEMLRKSLEYESSGRAQVRGITKEDPDLQTFEINLPKNMLSDFKHLYIQNVEEQISNRIINQDVEKGSMLRFASMQRALPKGLDISKLDEQMVYMNFIMSNYIEQVRVEPKKYVRNKSACARLLKLESQLPFQGNPILYRDPWMSFTDLFYMSLDWDILMFEAIVISFIDIVIVQDNNQQVYATAMLGILLAYVFDMILYYIRAVLGKRNLAKKSLTDEMFLL